MYVCLHIIVGGGSNELLCHVYQGQSELDSLKKVYIRPQYVRKLFKYFCSTLNLFISKTTCCFAQKKNNEK